ncbi:PAAR domain-containing protein [Pseudomonas sp. GL-RE-20]|uniref:PAAR domain-containing protein n=2 Tax=Pseudomonas TaxID=286 RepID=UPI00295839C5|nr:PAAR domain-containing protein [Pseudomonas sp. GL-RE-20]
MVNPCACYERAHALKKLSSPLVHNTRLMEFDFMSQGFVLLGDRTTHDGEVISASSTTFVHGKPVALVGDEVSCPAHGTNPIVDGCSDCWEDGRAMVVDGCRSECGCQVISSAPDCGVG